MADVKWIKITTDMFDNRKIKHLRRLPEGNNIVLIWVMLLTMAGRCNSGGMIFLTENIPYTPKMLADELDFEENTIRLALEALSQLGMIVTSNDYFAIAGWEDHQNIEGMEKIREQNRLRQAKFKANRKLLTGNVTDNVTVTQGNATDKEEDKEEDKEIESKDAPVALPAPKRKVFQKPSLEDIKAYCKEGGYSIDAQRFLDYYESNGWMVGRNKMKDWKAAVRSWASRDKKPKVERDYGDPEDFYK